MNNRGPRTVRGLSHADDPYVLLTVSTVLALDKPVEHIIAHEGRKGLEILPGIGKYLSFTIANLVETGVVQTLSRPRAVKADAPAAVLLEAIPQSTP